MGHFANCSVETQCAALCETPIVLTVRGANGKPGPTVSVTGTSGQCETNPDTDTAVCYLGNEPGMYTLDIQAPGYQSRHLDVDVASDMSSCCANYRTEFREITLEPMS